MNLHTWHTHAHEPAYIWRTHYTYIYIPHRDTHIYTPHINTEKEKERDYKIAFLL